MDAFLEGNIFLFGLYTFHPVRLKGWSIHRYRIMVVKVPLSIIERWPNYSPGMTIIRNS